MVPSPRLLAPLLLTLACDADLAARTPTPTPVLAAKTERKPDQARPGKARPSPAEREAKRAAKRARADEPDKPGTQAGPTPVEHPKPTSPPKTSSRRPAAPATADASLPACPPANAITYRSFGAGFLRTWCTGCHSSTLAAGDRQDAPGDVNFDRPALYKPLSRLVYERAVLEAHAAADPKASASPMPPAGAVPEADLRRLSQWIACGSPGV